MTRNFYVTIAAILMVLIFCISGSSHEFDDYYYQHDESETWNVINLSPFSKSEKAHSGIEKSLYQISSEYNYSIYDIESEVEAAISMWGDAVDIEEYSYDKAINLGDGNYLHIVFKMYDPDKVVFVIDGITIYEKDLVELYSPYAFTAYFDDFDSSGTHFKYCNIVIDHQQYNKLDADGRTLVLAHEIGHAYGLGHVDNDNRIMNQHFSSNATVTEEDKNGIRAVTHQCEHPYNMPNANYESTSNLYHKKICGFCGTYYKQSHTIGYRKTLTTHQLGCLYCSYSKGPKESHQSSQRWTVYTSQLHAKHCDICGLITQKHVFVGGVCRICKYVQGGQTPQSTDEVLEK